MCIRDRCWHRPGHSLVKKIKLLEMKNEKKTTWDFLLYKYSKFGSIFFFSNLNLSTKRLFWRCAQQLQGTKKNPKKTHFPKIEIFLDFYEMIFKTRKTCNSLYIYIIQKLCSRLWDIFFDVSSSLQNVKWWNNALLGILLMTLRAQSFTSLMAELCQDINRVSSFSRCLNGSFPWRNCSV